MKRLNISDSGNVSIDSLMDTGTRTFTSVAILGMLFSLALGMYGKIVGDIDVVLNNGSTRTAAVGEQIENGSIYTPNGWYTVTPQVLRMHPYNVNHCGSVSVEGLMDTTTRVYVSMAVLGMLLTLTLGTYGSMSADIDVIQHNGSKVVDEAADKIRTEHIIDIKNLL